MEAIRNAQHPESKAISREWVRERLSLLDPEFGGRIERLLGEGEIPGEHLRILLEETLWAVSQEVGFGYAAGEGFARLISSGKSGLLFRYRELVREFGGTGPFVGRLIATHLVPVLLQDDDGLTHRFLAAVEKLLSKGSYTLTPPLEGLSGLLEKGDAASALAFLDLLIAVFSQKITYNQSQRLSHDLPAAVARLLPEKRAWQLASLCRAARADFSLAAPFLEGMKKGLDLLLPDALEEFVDAGLARLKRDPEAAPLFFSLESRAAADLCGRIRTTVSFHEISTSLARYLKARTGLPLSVRPMSAMPEIYRKGQEEDSMIISDGANFYLPDQIGRFDDRAENRAIYRLLVRLESLPYEFGTFDFDIDRFRDLLSPKNGFKQQGGGSDLESFFATFSQPELARDLFEIFERGRLRHLAAERYPGLLRSLLPAIEAETGRSKGHSTGLLHRLYCRIGLGMGPKMSAEGPDSDPLLSRIQADFSGRLAEEPHPGSELSALLVWEWHDEILSHFKHSHTESLENAPFFPLFGQRLRPDLFFATHYRIERKAENLKKILEKEEVKLYKGDLRRLLLERGGTLTPGDLRMLIEEHNPAQHSPTDLMHLLEGIADVPELFLSPEGAEFKGEVFRYQEWDNSIDDYLLDHVRVRIREVSRGDPLLYDEILTRRRDLIRGMRRAFEHLRPQGLKLLRPWEEGDAFDHRSLIDFAVAKHAGLPLPERLFIKRVKQERDVAVLLLADLSRSTANPVMGTDVSVLDLEKEAIVLFCEALQVSGDAFGIAGFSGTGRLGVDYYPIKDLEWPIDASVKARIAGMSSQRSTRMGAAVRHAAHCLEKHPAKVRVLLILSDGFPNDADYKRTYAVEDTRMAIFEARSRNIHTRAITVNIAQDSRLDSLYGSLRHNLITDVRDLPERLLRIYSAMTR